MIKMRDQTNSKALSLPDKRVHIQAFWAFTFAVLVAIGAQIEIPNQPVPFTMQTFFVLSAGALLGKRGGAVSMGMYLILGAIGLPIFPAVHLVWQKYWGQPADTCSHFLLQRLLLVILQDLTANTGGC